MTRPGERLPFPYTVNQIYHPGPFTVLTYHSRVPCALKKQLLPSHAAAKKLILPFAREVYGEDRRFVILHEGPLYRLISLLQIKKLAALFRR